MSRKLLTSALAIWILASTGPAFAFACTMPCKLFMSQEQMMDCARACNNEKAPLSIGKAPCIELQIDQAPQFTTGPAVSLEAPLFAEILGVAWAEVKAPHPSAEAPFLRGPPLSPAVEFPTANAPPQLI
jgi:hypothetical protein